jgi:endonuclease/exonuclease/phosphatase (EEP) superfamily protein YafD
VVRSGPPLTARVAALCAAALALCLAVGGLSAADGAGDDGAAPEPTTSRLRIVTYNADALLDPETAMLDLEKIMGKDPDVIALQELASPDKRRAIRERYIDCDGCVWGANMPGPAVPGETPVLYRTDRFELKDSGSVQVTEPTYVGKAGAGPSTINAKFINWVHLSDLRSGRPVYILNNHTVPSVQDKSGGPNRGFPERLQLFRKHMRGLQSLVREITAQKWGLVFVTGDLNVNFRRDRVLAPAMFPYRMLGDVGLEASYEAVREPPVGTHTLRSGNDTRLIDYVYFLPRPSVTASALKILWGLSSDHRPLMVDFDVKVATPPATTPPTTTP